MKAEWYKTSLLSNCEMRYGVADDQLLVHRNKDQYLGSAYQVLEDGKVAFRLHYPNASQVKLVSIWGEEFNLEKEGEFFTGAFDLGTGLIGVDLYVDGSLSIYPFLPIGYGNNQANNYVDVPDEQLQACITEKNVPHGTVNISYLDSQVTGRLERFLVYVPAGYEADPCRRYPVLYLQHGHGENEMVWFHQGKVNLLYDALIAEGKAVPALVVMCNGMYYEEDGSGITLDMQRLPKLLVEEIIPYVDSHYRTIADKEHRGMAGLSMGSAQTSMIAFTHPELFDYVGIFSGFVQDALTGSTDHVTDERLTYMAGQKKLIFRAMGDEDRHFARFESDDELLERYQVPHIRKLYHGKHEWKVWRWCFCDFVEMIFKED